MGTVDGRTYAFVGLERNGGVMVYDVSFPRVSRFVQYANDLLFDDLSGRTTADDFGPEGIAFVAAVDSPIAEPLLLVAHEVSGEVTIYKIVTLPMQ